MTNRALLAVFSHPDDEVSAGGTLAHYARAGAAAHLICATRGEVGDAPPGFKGFASIGEMRQAELECASNNLGLESVNFLGYRDSGMPGSPDNAHPQSLVSAPLDQVAQKIAAQIRRSKPQVVITFDPIGGYRHPDHIAVHQATVGAFQLAGDATQDIESLPPYAPQKLYFVVFSHRLLRTAVRLLRLSGQDPTHFGKNKDVDLTSMAQEDYPTHARIDVRESIAEKERASACHSSQLGGMGGRPVRLALRIFAGTETFMRAIPAQPPAHVEQDLFEGVEER